MSQKAFINVILPLKLAWEPFYSLPCGTASVRVGDRVLVPFSGRTYLGVVSCACAAPGEDTALRTKDIFGVHPSKTPVLPVEIDYWRQLAEYYMCTVGEIYKAAYPSVKDEVVSPRKKLDDAPAPLRLPLIGQRLEGYFSSLKEALGERPVLLQAPSEDSVALMLALAGEYVRSGLSVLWLVPEVKMEKSLQERLGSALGSSLVLWGSHLTPAWRRAAAQRVRLAAGPVVVLATRSAVFLPFSRLDLVMVQDEQDSSYKQTSPAPRYNAREAALMLSRLHGARALLQSASPSLDSLYNCRCGKFSLVSEPLSSPPDIRIIDLRAETRKGGMDGSVSRKMSLLASRAAHPAFFKPSRALYPKTEELFRDLSAAASANGFTGFFFTDDLLEKPLPPDTDFLGIFGLDSLLGKMDFRSDERTFQVVMQAFSGCVGNLRTAAIQTREASHPLFISLSGGSRDSLLAERRAYSYPPYTRFVDVVFQGSAPSRIGEMSSSLALHLQPRLPSCRIVPFPGGLRITFRRSAALAREKETLMQAVEEFRKKGLCCGTIHFDVDPLG